MSGTISASLDRLQLFAPTFCTLLLAVVLWVLNHPYAGFSYHDARIYALLALHWLDPVAYAHDPFFMFGSQDDFTIFSPIYGSLIRWCGLSLATQIVMAVAAVFWIGASWMLASRVFDDWRVCAYIVLSLAIYSFNYSPNHATFVLNENFTSARVIAIPMMGIAIAFSLERNWMLAGILALLSMAIHPLLAIWGVILMVGVRLSDRVLLGLLAVAAALVVGASLMPGPAAFHLMDAEWAEVVRHTSSDVLVGSFAEIRLNATLFWIAALLLGSRFGSPHMRRWYEVTALVASYGFLLALLCSYFYPIQGVIQAQTWRVMWLAIYLGMFALIDIARAMLFDERDFQAGAVIAVIMLFVFADHSAILLLSAWLLLRESLLTAIAATWRKIFQSYSTYVNALAIGLVLVMAPTYFRSADIESQSLMIDWLPGDNALKGILIFGGLGLGPLIWCRIIAQPLLRTAMTLLLIPALVVAILEWDHRGAALREWESFASCGAQSEALHLPIHKGDVVLWPGNSNRVLFEIRTASYASSLQAIGIVFSQEKTSVLASRLRRVAIASIAKSWPIGELAENGLFARYKIGMDSLERNVESLHDYEPVQLTGSGIRYVCDDAALDWVVSGNPVYASGFKPIVIQDGYRHAPMYFYRCGSMNQVRSR